MDAVKFVKVRRRMYEKKCITRDLITGRPEDVVSETEKWAKENPVKTRQSEFLKQWPEAEIDIDENVINLCPARLIESYRGMLGLCARNNDCIRCKRKFWLEEIE